MSEKQDKLLVIVSGGIVSSIYSSIPNKEIEVQVIEVDSRRGREKTEEYVQELIESGALPYVIYE